MRRLLLVCCSILFLCVPSLIRAEDCDAYCQKLKEIDALKGKISELQGQAKTLSQAVSYLTNKKTLTQRQVEATQSEIEALSIEISSLGGKIETTEETLDAHIGALITDVQHSYKQLELDPFRLLLSSQSFADLQTRSRYVLLAQSHHAQVLQKTAAIKDSYDKQKQEKVMAQTKIAALKKKLEQQRKDIEQQEQAKKQLLSDTKNSESTYQKLLRQAEAELASFRSFTASKGGGVVPPQNSPDGWYFSQRDQRWAGVAIGNSGLTSRPDTILDVGCLVSSVAMVKKKYGEDVTPTTIALNPGYFYLNTGSMRRPWPAPNGYHYEVVDRRDSGLIDSALKDGTPVIVKLSVRTNVVGTHFIVLKSGSGGDYVIHDPWEGYDKKFSQFYSTGQIIATGILKKN